MIKVKICGITNIEDALFCSKEGADALGFIFTKRSPRYIKETEAKKIIIELDPFIVKAGVFIDEEKDKVLDIAASLGLDVLQFHGKEPPSYCNFFKSKFKIIKTFFPDDIIGNLGIRDFAIRVNRYKIDAFLFDIRYENKLKGEKSLSKNHLSKISLLIKDKKRVIISGGLNPDNIGRIRFISPYGVDVASGVEQFIGKKDKELVRRFIELVKKY